MSDPDFIRPFQPRYTYLLFVLASVVKLCPTSYQKEWELPLAHRNTDFVGKVQVLNYTILSQDGDQHTEWPRE